MGVGLPRWELSEPPIDTDTGELRLAAKYVWDNNVMKMYDMNCYVNLFCLANEKFVKSINYVC